MRAFHEPRREPIDWAAAKKARDERAQRPPPTEAICEAVTRANMRPNPPSASEQPRHSVGVGGQSDQQQCHRHLLRKVLTKKI
jgi:hypothetical protein